MSLRFAIIAILSLLPLSGISQQLATSQGVMGTPATVPALLVTEWLGGTGAAAYSPSSQIIPVWATKDGRLLAIVAMSQGHNELPIQPLEPSVSGVSDWRLIDATALASGGLRWRISDNFHADATVGPVFSADPALLLSWQCDQTLGVCPESSTSSLRLNTSPWIGRLDFGWAPTNSFDLSYGMSWLRNGDALTSISNPKNFSGSPSLVMPMNTPYQLSSGSALTAQGRWYLGAAAVLEVGAGVAHERLNLLGPALGDIDLNQTSLSLGLSNGSLRGALVGHVLSTDQPALLGKRWTSVDLGVSWRTPWQAEFSVGAQNLWSAPLDPAVKDADMGQNRVPYVQYRQDL